MKKIHLLALASAITSLTTAPLLAADPTNLFPEGTFDSPIDIEAKAPNPATQDPLNAQEGILYAEPGNYRAKGCSIEFTNEGNENVLKFIAPESFSGILRTYIPLRLPNPPPTNITLSIRWATSNLKPAENAPVWASAQCDPIFVLENGEKKTINNTLRLTQDTGGEFTEMEKTVPVPDGAKMIILQPGLYLVTGTLAIDEIKVLAE